MQKVLESVLIMFPYVEIAVLIDAVVKRLNPVTKGSAVKRVKFDVCTSDDQISEISSTTSTSVMVDRVADCETKGESVEGESIRGESIKVESIKGEINKGESIENRKRLRRNRRERRGEQREQRSIPNLRSDDVEREEEKNDRLVVKSVLDVK